MKPNRMISKIYRNIKRKKKFSRKQKKQKKKKKKKKYLLFYLQVLQDNDQCQSVGTLLQIH